MAMSDQECLMTSVKKEVRSLLITAKEGLTPSHLEQEFKSMIGEQLPFRALGYHSVMELVQDMPDVVNICPQGNGIVILKAIADESTKGIASLVAKQKSRPKPQPSRHRLNFPFRSTSRSGLPQRSQTSPRLPWRGQIPPTLPAGVRSELKELLGLSPVLLSDFDKAFVQRFGRPFDITRYGFFSMYEVLRAASDIITLVQTRAGSMLTLKNYPRKMPVKVSTCNVVVQPDKQKQTPHGTVPAPGAKTPSPTCILPVENQNVMPKEESDPLLVPLKMETPLAKPVERIKQIEKELKMTLAQKGPGGIVSFELKDKIRMILTQHPEGLLASNLPVEFEVHFKEPLPVRELGFLNLTEFVGALSDILHIECKEEVQDWLIFDVDSQSFTDSEQANSKTAWSGALRHVDSLDKHKLPNWDLPLKDSKNPETKFSTVTKMSVPHLGIDKLHIMQEIMEKEIPPDAVRCRSLYGLPELDSSALVGLFVEYIVSPSQFYVRIQSEETSNKLIDMMIEMRRCYSSKNVADRYVIPEDLIQPGQLCCVKSSEDRWWYRVIVHQVLNHQEVEVFYPDFGNMEIVRKSLLRFLKSCYAKLPAQAIPCSLAWMKPKKDDWTVSAIREFQRLCGLKLLVGVTDEYRDGILYLFLCDTSSDEDIYLHNVLRLEGHAVVCKENVLSKDFRKMNPYALYIKRPKQDAETNASILQLKFLGELSGTTYSEPCMNEVVSQEKYILKDCNENSSTGQNEQILEAKDASSLCSDIKIPYMEPVDFYNDIWDEDWILSNYYKQNKNDEMGDSSDVAVVKLQPPNGEGNKDEAKHSQEVVQKAIVDISHSIERKKCSCPEPQGKTQNLSEEMERQNTLGPMTDSLSQAVEEFYVSFVPSKKSEELSKPDLNVDSAGSWFPQSGDASSEKRMDDISRSQAVTLCDVSCGPTQQASIPSAFVFTAELQRSLTFCVPCNPTVALGASARLAGSGGCLSLSLWKMNT